MTLLSSIAIAGYGWPIAPKEVHASHPQAITILITAYGIKDIFLSARKIGVKDFIDKPFTAKNIEKSLIRLMENCEQEI